MTLRALQFRLEAAVVRLALGLLTRLRPATASNIGGAIARTIGPWLPVSRVADANLRLALPELDRATRRRVIRGVWDNLGRTAAELPHVAALTRTASGPGWDLEGEQIFRGLVRNGGPAIFFSGHIGNWEMLPAVAASFGMPLSSFYRAAANPIVDGIIMDLRQRAIGADVPQFPKGAQGARSALGLLRDGGFLGMLVDQKMNDGIPVPFFGHTAMTAPAAAAYAIRFRCPIVPAYAQRLGPARFRLVCEEPLPLPDSGDRQADIASLTLQINGCLERWIRARPAEWLWLHRRWPREATP
ncbi:LpxL/LpxP family acyltransferase [Limobrevibacterium gyesilva]|uniref:Lauroyl acyltransferase n=1 Tax=Limobrevibacterium gyesilva TaxID=2991712 RepID=A0AA42CCG8_9PROT|nr:lauroyl acyltransferase [Limobrevibacterium gyesilva]MCW3473343.1 lauroyl acyltransferase [Limobrevibacterium gyesilva]